MKLLHRFYPVPLLGALSVATTSACLDIEYTPPPAGGGAGGASATVRGGSQGAGGTYTPPPCLETCANRTPAGAQAFFAVASCTEEAEAGPCAEACAPGAPDSAYGPADCAVPGEVDPAPACNACLKHECCAKLQSCFSDSACITVGICATGCQ